MSWNPLRDSVLAALALIFIAASVALFVSDLSRKVRFLKVLSRARRKSWLSLGAFLLVTYSALCAALLLGAIAGNATLCRYLLWPAVLAGIGAAGYTAFLFGQCAGCALWHTPLLPVHRLVQAVLAGGALLMFLPAQLGATPRSQAMAIVALSIALALHLLMMSSEVAISNTTDNAKYAAWLIAHGPYRRLFWMGAVGMGGVLPLLLLCAFSASPVAAALSGVLALGGLLAFEWCFVMAGQCVPNS
jgi:formate-dependent nitrite reductase membrane component NrfD